MENTNAYEISEDEILEENESAKEEVLLDEKIFQEDQCNELHTNEFRGEKTHIEKPTNGMIFYSSEKVIEYYANFAKQEGFGFVKRNSATTIDGKLKYLTLACVRQGRPLSEKRNILKPNPIIRIFCKAKISTSLCPDGKYKVSSVNNKHNHALSPGKVRYFRCNKNMNQHVKRRLEINDKAGIRVNNFFYSMVVEAGGYDNLTFVERDFRNQVDKRRRTQLEGGDAETLHQYFLRMRERNDGFYSAMDLDRDSRLRNVFWADARSRAAYESFGDVVTFDTTYLTNKYKMPFAPFVGVNHHGHSILLGCGLILKEDTESFIWLFQSWLSCMAGRAPTTIITDQDKAMQNAIEHVFPSTRHRWCIWHIMKKIPEKLSGFSKYKEIKKYIKDVVYNSLTYIEFEEKWASIIEKFDLENNEWLSGLYLERERWVPSFLKSIFWAGMSSTQRSESMNAFFDKYVNRKTTLKFFVEQYDNALRDKIEKEATADYGSFHATIPLITHYSIEKQFQEAYTNEKFKEIQEEFRKKMYCLPSFWEKEGTMCYYVVTEEREINEKIKDLSFTVELDEKDFDVRCTCKLFEFRGILCRHILAVLIIICKTKELPEKYILSRWRKDLKRKHSFVKNCYDDLGSNPSSLRFDKLCKYFYEIAEMGTESDEKCQMIMEYIYELKGKLQLGEINKGSAHETQNSPIVSTKEVSKVVNPVVAQSKGRPSTKRNESKVDQIVRKKIKKSKNDQKTKKNVLGEIHNKELEDLATPNNMQNHQINIENPFSATFTDNQLQRNSYMTNQFMPHMNHIASIPQMNHLLSMPHVNYMGSPFMPPYMNHMASMPQMNQLTSMPHMNHMASIPQMNHIASMPHVDYMGSPFMPPYMNHMENPFMPSHINHTNLLQMEAKHDYSQSNLANVEVSSLNDDE